METQANAKLICSPPYSPDLNPIEKGVQPSQKCNKRE